MQFDNKGDYSIIFRVNLAYFLFKMNEDSSYSPLYFCLIPSSNADNANLKMHNAIFHHLELLAKSNDILYLKCILKCKLAFFLFFVFIKI